MQDVFVVSAVRTPIGKQKGAFRNYMAPELLSLVLDESIKRIDIDPNIIEDVVMLPVLFTRLENRALHSQEWVFWHQTFFPTPSLEFL